jgi:hypothetical protein
MFRQLMLGLTLAAALFLVAPTSQASASWWGSSSGWSSWWSKTWSKWTHDHDYKCGHDGGDSGDKGGAIPELDPSAGGSALVLLLGGAAYIVSRRREEDLA